MNSSTHRWRGLLDVAVLLPLCFQLCVIADAIVRAHLENQSVAWGAAACIGLGFVIFCFYRGLERARRFDGEGGFFDRYQPVIVAGSYTMLAGLVAIHWPVAESQAVFRPFVSVFSLAHLTSLPIIFLFQLMALPSPWPYLAAPLVIYLSYAGGMAWGFQERSLPSTRWTSRLPVAALFLAGYGAILWQIDAIRSHTWVAEREPALVEEVALWRYRPFKKDNELVKVDPPGWVVSTNYPRLDGATALYPIYAAAAQAIYAGVDAKRIGNLVVSSKTPSAYKKLIAGEVDLIFAAQPSPQQRAEAEAAGVTFHLTPIGREAFIFFVHADNRVNGLTSEQIRGIYTRKIRNWSELGGSRGRIAAFQRPAGSGSQTALEQRVLQGEKPFAPLREEYAHGMGGIMQRVASYRHTDAAIGYSFRFFATKMNPLSTIKLLEIDGVAPTRETIRSGHYPYTVDLFAVTTQTTNPHVAPLIQWFLSPAGQRLIDDTGYVSLSPDKP